MSVGTPTARSERLLACGICTLLMAESECSGPWQCVRCGSKVWSRKPQSLERAVALLVAAAILYVPANVLPVIHTTTIGRNSDDTILSGVLALWEGGSWPLALLVFVASVLVPVLKFSILGLLLATTRFGSRWALYDRTVLYRLIEFIGRWSMLDIFVVTLMVTLVQLRGVATIHAGTGAMAFGAVVVLMMYAVQAFDPRLMWDQVQ
jgi:paraquat-inducible protein A